jgi:iron complex transport system ATP-binding protein
MITLENLSYTIKDKVLLNKVSCCFETGMIHLILGPNGAGKSTLMRLLSGELNPTEGSVKIENTDLRKISLNERARYRAVLSQSIDLTFPLSVREVVMLGRLPHFSGKPANADETACEEAMRFFDVIGLKERNYLTLSGGEKQRVQFARVFVQLWSPVDGKKRYLLLDEPLTFLDIYYQYDLMQKTKDFVKNNTDVTIIGVVHDLNIAALFADTIILLKDGRLHDRGTPEKVLTEGNVKDVFAVVIKSKFNVSL